MIDIRAAVTVCALAFVAGCASTPVAVRDSAAAEVAPPVVNERPAAADASDSSSAPPAAPPAAVGPAPPKTAWDRLRDAPPFAACDEPRTARRIARYVAQPAHFDTLLTRAARYLPLVTEALVERDVPATFALLPVVESEYRATPARGKGPAGIWQFMPVTARAQGLAVSRADDARLDADAATRAAAALLAGLGQRFEHDWPLATMAFNAGEFRVRGALRRLAKDPAAPSDPVQRRDRLALNPITHDHLAKLAALDCIVRAPAAHGVTLPLVDDGDTWRALRAPFALDRDLALALSTLPRGTFDALNPALRADTVPAGRAWLVPARAHDGANALLARLDATTARHWRTLAAGTVRRADDDAPRIPADLLASLNAHAAPGGNGEIVPTRAIPAKTRRVAVAGDASSAPLRDGHYRVRAGDNPWLIARRLRVKLDLLLEWNALSPDAMLRPGQWLRVVPPTP